MTSWKLVATFELLAWGLLKDFGSPTLGPHASVSVCPSVELQGSGARLGEIERIKIIPQSGNQKPLSGQDKTEAISCLYLQTARPVSISCFRQISEEGGWRKAGLEAGHISFELEDSCRQ